MSKARMWKCAIVSILIVLYLIFAPNVILDGIEKGRVSAFETEKEDFNGVIEVWHVAGFKLYSGAVGNLLKECCNSISDKHFGVYFNVISMSETEYDERVQRGESADIYSFPLGFEYGDKLLSLDSGKISDIRDGFLQTGMQEGEILEVPYFYSGYCIAANCELLKEQPTKESVTADALNEMCQRLNTEKHTAISGSEICAALFGIKGEVASIDSFKGGSSEFAITDFRTVGDIDRKNAQGKGFPISYFPIGSYTDLVQYICFNSKIDDAKLQYAYELMNEVLSDDLQEKISQMGGYTVGIPDDIEKLRDNYTSVSADLFSLYMNPKIPNSFSYRMCKDAISDEARAALSDDDLALKLKNRLDNLIKQS